MRSRADDSARKPSGTDVHTPYHQWGLGQPAQAPLGEMARGGRIAGGT